MEQFATEEQQVEAIKRFWSEHGISLIVGACLGLAGLFGWQYYSDTQIEAKETASQSYQRALETLVNSKDSSAIDAVVTATDVGGYADIASLLAAKQMVEDKDLQGAAKYLQTAVDNSSDPSLKQIALLRLARVQLALAAYEQALATVDLVTDEAFKAQREEIKGDIFSSQGNFAKARMAYSSALETNTNSNLLQMKLDNLAVSAG